MGKIQAEYIWIDGQKPTAKLRSKTKIIEGRNLTNDPEMVPKWGFDGSSTKQATGNFSDCALNPVALFKVATAMLVTICGNKGFRPPEDWIEMRI